MPEPYLRGIIAFRERERGESVSLVCKVEPFCNSHAVGCSRPAPPPKGAVRPRFPILHEVPESIARFSVDAFAHRGLPCG